MSAVRQNFLQAHWDWLVALAGVGALAAAGFLLMQSIGTSAEESASRYEAQLSMMKPAHEGVAAANLTVLTSTFRGAKTPPMLSAVDPKKANFLASERRLICRKGDEASKAKACGKPIPADSKECPFCGMKQSVVKVEVDSDHDGMPNDWEKKYGFNPNDAKDALLDSDKDGFTNLEEFQAKTDPKDSKSHPDYLDYVTIVGGLKQTALPFYFNAVTPIPGGHRFTFRRLGVSGFDSKVFVKMNEEIASVAGKNSWKSGWKIVSYEQKQEKRKLAGTTMEKMVDVSTVEVQRLADGKKLTARIDERNVAIESQAELQFSRGEGKQFLVAEGTEFELFSNKYKVVKLGSTDKGCEVTVLDLTTKKEKILR